MGKQGFTLIELVVCIAVLAILAGIGVPSMMGYRNWAAHGVNIANLLATRRQIEAVYQAFPGELEAQKDEEVQAVNGLLTYGTWDIPAPVALGVTPGSSVVEVAEGSAMRAVLNVSEDMAEAMPSEKLRLKVGCVGTYWEEWGGSGAEEAPEELLPEEEEPPAADPVPEPTVPEHVCRDRDENCLCDVEGCGAAVHEEHPFLKNGSCEKCGLHFVHRGVEDLVCDTCRMDLMTGQTHVCSWAEGVCRCRCGASRCDHGSTGVEKCPVCGNFNTWMERCGNCN